MLKKYFNNNIKKKKGYSLLEVIVSIAIISFSMVVMMKFLVFTIQTTKLLIARSTVRDEIYNITNLIARDIRNASKVGTCNSNICIIFDDAGDQMTWTYSLNTSNVGVINKTVISASNGKSYDVYDSSNSVNINKLDFSSGFINDLNSNQIQNIVVTVQASHVNPVYKINNIISQISVSTRNINVIQ